MLIWSLVLLAIVVAVHCYQYWTRNILFYSHPSNINQHTDRRAVLSPVCGTLVYANSLSIGGNSPGNVLYEKKGRVGKLSNFDELPDGKYYHIGVYMSPFDNHHLLMPAVGSILDEKLIEGTLSPMLDFDDMVNLHGWWKNWLHKKSGRFINFNQKTKWVIRTKSGRKFDMYMIYDRFVSGKIKVPMTFGGRECLGMVCRGSQMDFLVPARHFNLVKKEVGTKINFNDILFVEK